MSVTEYSPTSGLEPGSASDPTADSIQSDVAQEQAGPPIDPSALSSKILRICVNSVPVLNSCYMPFLQNGGIFIPRLGPLELKQRIFLVLRLPDLPGGKSGRFGITAQVAWITPVHAEGLRTSGIGLHFDNPSEDLRSHIETLLDSLDPIERTQPGHTL